MVATPAKAKKSTSVSSTNVSLLKRREVIAYGIGDVSASLVWNSVSAFALLFYTDVALLPAALIGTLFFFSRIFDAIFDLGIGLAVDRTRSKWGKARPYLLFGAIPFGILGVMTFYSPEGSESFKFYYAALTYFVLGLLLSVVTIPYSAMLPMMSDKPRDRVDLSAARSVATSIGVIIITALFMPGVEYFGQGNQAKGFLMMAIITSVLATVMLFMTFAGCKERIDTSEASASGIGSDVILMLKNRAWNVASFFALLNFIRFGALLSITPFFAINVLGKPWMISVLLPTLSGTLLLGAFLARPFLNRFGLKATNTSALILGLLTFALLPLVEEQPWLFITFYVLSSLIISITMTSIYAMASEAVDFHQLWFAKRNEGLLAAGVSLAIKVGMAIGTAGVAYVLAWGGYSAGAVSEQSQHAISLVYYGLPPLIFILQLACIQFYPDRSLLNGLNKP